jgi:hypothetical protein
MSSDLLGPSATHFLPDNRQPPSLGRVSRRLRTMTQGIGGFYLTTAGINIGLAIGRPHLYDRFADQALFGWVRSVWSVTFRAHPAVWAGSLAVGEALLGAALLTPGRVALAGCVGVVAFHVALLAFGWWAWVWAVPVLALTIPLTLAYRAALKDEPAS